MKEMKVVLSDNELQRLEKLSKAVGLSAEEILRRGLAEYLERLTGEPEFDPVGFGMWKGRSQMQDSAKWVQRLRSQEWDR